MKVDNEKTWQYETHGVDGDVTLFGVNIFDYEWHDTGQEIEVRDPLRNQKHIFQIYTVLIDNKEL